MTSKVTRFERREGFTKVTTSSGVVGIVASDVPIAALEGLHAKLLARQTERMAANNATNSGVPESSATLRLNVPLSH